MEEVTDETSRCTGTWVCSIEIGKAGMVATIRARSDEDPARRVAETRNFGTTKKEVLALADWLLERAYRPIARLRLLQGHLEASWLS
jgi:hypothetical protein